MNEIAELSADIHVITAEINAYQRVAGEAIFEIGRRLHEVKYNPAKYGLPSGTDKEGRTIVARGAWGEWLRDVNVDEKMAPTFLKVYTELGGSKFVTGRNSGIKALYEIAQLPPEQREKPQTVPSTGEVKAVNEMTVRELREVKKALKEAEAKAQQAEVARRDAEIKARATEPIIKEIEVEHK